MTSEAGTLQFMRDLELNYQFKSGYRNRFDNKFF